MLFSWRKLWNINQKQYIALSATEKSAHGTGGQEHRKSESARNARKELCIIQNTDMQKQNLFQKEIVAAE